MTADPIRCAIVGLGQGLENAYVAMNHPRFDLRVVCDLNREPYRWMIGETRMEDSGHEYATHSRVVDFVKLLREHPRVRQVDYTADFPGLLRRKDVEAVLLVVPGNLHESFTREALAAEKFVLCTKPMADTLASARRMLEMAELHPGRYMCGFPFPFSAWARSALEVISSGEIGAPRLIRFDYHRKPFRPHFRFKPPAGGTVVEEGCHWLDLFYQFAGQPGWRRVTGLSGLNVNGAIQNIEDNGALVIDYENGVRATHAFSYFEPQGHRHRLEISGDRGSIEWRDGDMHVTSDLGHRAIPMALTPTLPKLNHPGYYEMHDAFAAMVREGRRPLSHARAAYENMLTACAAQQAIETGETVHRAAFEAAHVGQMGD